MRTILSSFRVAVRFGGYAKGVFSFGREERGSITIQMLILSILLFGTTGLVMDSGRVYHVHSQLQAYADQVSLAAAKQLDGQPGAIERASYVVNGFNSGDAGLITDEDSTGTTFAITQLVFYSQFPANTSGVQTDISAAAAYATSVDSEAKFVAAVVEEVELNSMVKAMMDLALPGGSGVPHAKVQALAVAGLVEKTCANISSIVMCNPWEGMTDTGGGDFYESIRDGSGGITGHQAFYFAAGETPVSNGTQHGSIFDWDVRNQLFRLQDPIGDATELCSPAYLASMALTTDEANAVASGNTSNEDYMTVRDRCLMARARAETVCVGETVQIRPAPGPMVLRALNTAFDIYYPPFNNLPNTPILTIDVDGDGNDETITLPMFFEPDAVPTTPYEPIRRDKTGMADSNNNGEEDLIDYLAQPPYYADGGDHNVGAYQTTPGPGYRALESGEGYYLANCLDDLLQNTISGGTLGTPCTPSKFASQTNYLPSSKITDALSHYYDVSFGRRGLRLPTGTNTAYEAYQYERSASATLRATAGESITYGAIHPSYLNQLDVLANTDTTDDYLASIKTGANAAHWNHGYSLINSSYERRKIRSLLVNCQAVVGAGPYSPGSYEATVETDVVGVVDYFLSRPVTQYCGNLDLTDPAELALATSITNATGGNVSQTSRLNCNIDSQVESRISVEFIEDLSDSTVLKRYTPQLVH